MEQECTNIIIAPTISDVSTLIIYRDSGEEVVLKINLEKRTMYSVVKLKIEEVNYIRENYLNNE